MNYRLNKNQLSASAYYCGAGIDIQPLLRFSDIVKDFVYVTVGISKKKLVDGISQAIRNLNNEIGDVIELISDSEFEISEIEHHHQSNLLNWKPGYLNDGQWLTYMNTFAHIAKSSEQFNIHFLLKRKIGNIERILNLYYLVGEALATYEVLYLQQNIAPKLFISIQTGSIEYPERFSNTMFEGHSARPLVWLRGVWQQNASQNTTIFSKIGVFNKKIGEFRNWNAALGVEIEGTTNQSANNENIVMAFGEAENWDISNKTEVINGEGIKIQKLLKPFEKLKDSCDIIISPYELHLLKENSSKIRKFLVAIENRSLSPSLLMPELMDLIELIYSIYSQNRKIPILTIGIIPFGYEDEWEYVERFAKSFKLKNEVKLNLDFYYLNPLDYYRL